MNKFANGQGVVYRAMGQSPEDFTILCAMPPENYFSGPRYKIKAQHEHFARVVMESDLTGSRTVLFAR